MLNKNITNKVCPICDEGHLHDCAEKDALEYRGVTRELPLLFSRCDSCGSETATAEQSRNNKRAMVTFKKAVDGFLTGAEVRALRKALGIRQEQAARMFGGGPVAFSKYETDDVTQSEPMDKLLRAAKKFPVLAAWLAQEAGEHETAAKIRARRFPRLGTASFVRKELRQMQVVQRKKVAMQSVTLKPSRSNAEDLLNAG